MSTDHPPLPPTAWHTTLLAKTRDRGTQTIADVLRCHLVLEEVIWQACCTRLKKPKPLSELMFAKKLQLLEALFGDEMVGDIYTMCRALNSLRNKFAHNVEDRINEELFAKFTQNTIPGWNRKGKPLNYSNEQQKLEIFIYAAHHLGEAILKIAFAEEIEQYNSETQIWLDDTRR